MRKILAQLQVYLQRCPGFLAAILTGVFLGTSFVPFYPWALLFAMVPLWVSWLKTPSWKNILLTGLIAGFVLSFITTYWIYHTIHSFGDLPMSVAIAGMLFYCTWGCGFILVSGILWKLIFSLTKFDSEKIFFPVLALATLTPLCQKFTPALFPMHFGYAWVWAQWPAMQTAEFLGTEGLSVLTFFINAIFVLALCARSSFGVVLALGVFISVNIWGYQIGKNIPEPDAVATALVVQTNIGNLRDYFRDNENASHKDIIQGYINLSGNFKNTDFILWPEAAYWGNPQALNSSNTLLKEFLKNSNTYLVTGGFTTRSGFTKNSIFYLDQTGGSVGPAYFKNYLMPFGEKLPGKDYLPEFALKLITSQVPAIETSGLAGTQASPIYLGELSVGPSICYDSLFPQLFQSLSHQKAHIFINLSNDSWYLPYQEPYQHLAVFMARAIEFRRPVVRSTNTGISAVIGLDGYIEHQFAMNEIWVKKAKVRYYSQQPPTFYEANLHLLSLILLGLLSVALIGAFLRL